MTREIKFGINMKALRTQRKLSQSEFSKQLNISQNVISQYETGTRFPSFENLLMLSDFFGVTLDELIYGSDLRVVDAKSSISEVILKEMPLDKLLIKYDVTVDGKEITTNEALLALKIIRFNRFEG